MKWLIFIGTLFLGSFQKHTLFTTLTSPNIVSNSMYKTPSENINDLSRFVTLNSIDSDLILKDFQIENLKNLCIVWGFLKYYHPEIRTGDYDWDGKLMEAFPEVITLENKESMNKFLFDWISHYEFQVEFEEKDFSEMTSRQKPDLQWIEESGFDEKLISVFKKIVSAKRNGNSQYVEKIKGSKKIEISKEIVYDNFDYGDYKNRLLSLFRHWNIVQYFYPYKYLIKEDWKHILSEFIPKYYQANNEIEYKKVVLEFITKVGDTHATIWADRNGTIDSILGVNYAPYEVSFVEGKFVITGYISAEGQSGENGLLIGDVLLSVDEVDIDQLVNSRLIITPASNIPTQYRELAFNLLRTNNDSMKITYQRDGIAAETSVSALRINRTKLYSRYYRKDTCYKSFNSHVHYLYLGSIKRKYISQIFKEIPSQDDVIIDLRCYPTDNVTNHLGEQLLIAKTEHFILSFPSITEPGLFEMTSPYSIKGKLKKGTNRKLIILVNELTQSKAEFMAMAFRNAPNSIIVGSTTAGADGDVLSFSLPCGLKTSISGLGIYYPDGRETQKVGIIPDEIVKPTIKGIRNNEDELLYRAIEILNSSE